MKTAKIKFSPTGDFIQYFENCTQQLEWIWDILLSFQLHNQCLKWYQWAKKKEKASQKPKTSADEFLPFSFDGIVECSLRFGKRSPYMYAACQIAVGGPVWVKDTSVVIHYKNKKGERKHKFGSKLIATEHPYKSLKPIPFAYREILGTPIKTVAQLDSMTRLNCLRGKEQLPELTIHSDYVGGLIKDFETAWKAYEDVALPDRSMPKFSRFKTRKMHTLSNRQSGCVRQVGEQLQIVDKWLLTPCDRTWKERIGGYELRSYRMTRRPSGWYICISVASPNEALRPTLKRKLDLRASEIRKQVEADQGDKERAKELLEQDVEYQTLKNALAELDEQIAEELKNAFGAKQTENSSTLKSGLRKIVSAENGREFNPNASRMRIEQHIVELQSKLDRIRDRNDKRLGASWRQSQRPATENEKRLQQQISRLHEKAANSSNAFNHKLSTRMVRTYDIVNWHEYDLKAMQRSPEPILAEDGSYFKKNKAERKAFLNRLLKMASIGDLKQKTQEKLTTAGKAFIAISKPEKEIVEEKIETS